MEADGEMQLQGKGAAGTRGGARPGRGDDNAISGRRVESGQAATTTGRAALGGPGGAAGGGQEDLPFMLQAPGSYEEFAALVEGRSAEQLSLAMQRIRTCNAIAFASENRRKMQVLNPIHPLSEHSLE